MYNWIPLSSITDLSKLNNFISPEYAPTRVAEMLANGISDAVKAVLVESNYIDKDYRSTYYGFYAKKGLRYRPDCVRLHFFDETVTFNKKALTLSCSDNELSHHYFGFMVLRPTGIATIGRTVLSPDIRSGACRYIITGNHKVHLLGYDLEIKGFPSMDQHSDISICAHAACWSILRHYSERYNNYREFLTHDITRMTHEFNPGGLVPSKGLQVSHAERVFQAAGTFPVFITRENPDDLSFYRQIGAYVESGFPLFAAMHKHAHAIAIVGYEWRNGDIAGNGKVRYAWNEIEYLAVADDNDLPYLSISTVDGSSPYSASDIDAFIVALPEKVFYSADAVDKLSLAIFKLGTIVDLPPADKTIIRYFITTGSALRRFVRDRESEFDPQLLAMIMKLPFAQFIWVVEFATETQWSLGKIEARAVVDATASIRDIMPFWFLHNRSQSLFFNRLKVGVDSTDMRILKLTDMGHEGFSRMDQNLRPTQAK